MTKKTVAIIGAGLAGTACAYVLKQCGTEPVIYEAGNTIAPGASGNDTGLYNPRISAARSPESEFYSAAFAAALRTFKILRDAQDDNIIDWNKCGALHLINDEKKEKRYRECAVNWGWPPDHMRIVNAAEASILAGVDIIRDALWLPDSGYVSPKKLCAAYAADTEIHLNAPIETLSDIKADAIIIANGSAAKNFPETSHLPITTVRGQITEINSSEISARIKCNICYGGYMTPAKNGIHTVGSTFQRWLNHTDILPGDDADNINKMNVNIPSIAGEYAVTGHRAAHRAVMPDHFPVVGQVAKNIYISAAHGSHGILSSLMAAHVIADMIKSGPMCLPSAVIERLSPARFN
jgi:tRNA 5-methylaminomethyl-2-thiouridine biosynthesis bifunctional protein